MSLYGLKGAVVAGLLFYLVFLVGYLEDVKGEYGSYRLHMLKVTCSNDKWRKIMLFLLLISSGVNFFITAQNLI